MGVAPLDKRTREPVAGVAPTLVAVVSGTVIPLNTLTRELRGIAPDERRELERAFRVGVGSPPLVASSVFAMPAPPPHARARTHRVIARSTDCDGQGHVNNATCLDMFVSGLPRAKVDALGCFVLEHTDALYAGDEILVTFREWDEDDAQPPAWHCVAELVVERERGVHEHEKGRAPRRRSLRAFFSSAPGDRLLASATVAKPGGQARAKV